MTRKQFLEDVDDICSLYAFCLDCDIQDELDDVYAGDGFDSKVQEELEYAYESGTSWRAIKDYLSNLPDYDYEEFYIYNDFLDWSCYSDCDRFDSDKEHILSFADEWGLFEEDEEEHIIGFVDEWGEVFDEDKDPVEEVELDAEPIDIGVFMSECNKEVKEFISRDSDTEDYWIF